MECHRDHFKYWVSITISFNKRKRRSTFRGKCKERPTLCSKGIHFFCLGGVLLFARMITGEILLYRSRNDQSKILFYGSTNNVTCTLLAKIKVKWSFMVDLLIIVSWKGSLTQWHKLWGPSICPTNLVLIFEGHNILISTHSD